MAWSNIIFNKAERIGWLVINRPEALNALNRHTLMELDEALDIIAGAADVDVLVLTGSGTKVFVAGADIKEMKELSPLAARDFARLGQRVLDKLERLPQPTIAAVNGFALGGGCELAMACDIRIAAAKARFGQPEVGLGITPGFGGTQRLARLVGKGVAAELIFSGDPVKAEQALRVGLVNKVVPDEELPEAVTALAKTISARSRTAVRLAKMAINHGLETDVLHGEEYEAEIFGLCFSAADQTEGMAAFIEKRPPQFHR